MLDDDANGTVTKYLNGPGIDNKLRSKTGTAVNYFLADHLGSTNGLADATGSLTATTGYDAFGNVTNPAFPSRYQFTGREFDSLVQLQFSRARFYDPKLGRFISEDPIGFGGGDVNLYGYVWNNPLHFVDPFGLNGWGTRFAGWLDGNIEYARLYYQGSDQKWVQNGLVNTGADLSYGFSDMFRVGNGLGHALFAPDENAYGRAAFIAMDVARAAGLATLLGGAGSRIPIPSGNKGLGTNPFIGKSPAEIDRIFCQKGYVKKGPNPMHGDGTYVNPRSGRGYHIDANHPPPKPPHVGVHRPRGKRKTMVPREYPL
ncbi:MAG TPA: RHS repeat-associated core domain-containing protein [Pyrinomonadaceae bacterium]|nr:RHS repeat-associated core domain-containing protein [Pyrinomonadaceae bacterium]HMP65656.1 RHS repeat-associated core domain-containing protein [Pyrinomonadaceae bacterium]